MVGILEIEEHELAERNLSLILKKDRMGER